jgi:very-short-patch-repair endonuclease
MRAHSTEAETRPWSIVRSGQIAGHRFRRQHIIFPYIVDFVCLPARLIVEADGSQHGDNRQDARRDAWLTRQGYRVLRFWNNDVLARSEAVAEAIYTAFNDPHPPKPAAWASPSPLKGEGLGAPHG